MSVKIKKLIVSIALPLAVGGVSALVSRSGMEGFNRVVQPPLSPPQWLFPVVWTILFVLMGIASYLVFEAAKDPEENSAITLYIVQLAVNFFWPVFFFRLGLYYFAFLWLVLLWVLILLTVIKFREISKTAAWLMLPYLVWVTFAGYLNLGVALLN